MGAWPYVCPYDLYQGINNHSNFVGNWQGEIAVRQSSQYTKGESIFSITITLNM